MVCFLRGVRRGLGSRIRRGRKDRLPRLGRLCCRASRCGRCWLGRAGLGPAARRLRGSGLRARSSVGGRRLRGRTGASLDSGGPGRGRDDVGRPVHAGGLARSRRPRHYGVRRQVGVARRVVARRRGCSSSPRFTCVCRLIVMLAAGTRVVAAALVVCPGWRRFARRRGRRTRFRGPGRFGCESGTVVLPRRGGGPDGDSDEGCQQYACAEKHGHSACGPFHSPLLPQIASDVRCITTW